MYLPFFGWQNIFKEFLTLVFMRYKQTFLWRSETLTFRPCYYHQFFDSCTSPLCLNTCQKKEHFPKYFFIFKGFQPKIGYNNLEFRKFAQGSKRFMLIRPKWELLLLYSNYFSILSFISWKSVCAVLSCVRSLKLKKWIVYWRSIWFQRNRFLSIIVTCLST